MKTHLRVVTNSERTCFRRCQREHHYAYGLGYRPIEDAEALRFGTLWHRGLETWWLGLGVEAAIEVATAGAVDAYEAAKLRVLLRGYDARWGAPSDDVVGVEMEFRAPITNPETGAASRTFEHGGKIDVLLRDGFVEHKTTSADIGLGSNYWRKLTLDPQVSTYYAGARALRVEPQRCIYDVVRKPQLRPSAVPLRDEAGFKIVLDANGERVYCKTPNKGGPKPRETADTKEGYVLQTRPETPEEYELRIAQDICEQPDKYYQRGEVVRLEADEREAEQDAWQLTRSMREAELAERYPRNADACERFGSVCAYFDVCCGTASLDDVTRFERVDNVHPELSAQAAE